MDLYYLKKMPLDPTTSYLGGPLPLGPPLPLPLPRPPLGPPRPPAPLPPLPPLPPRPPANLFFGPSSINKFSSGRVSGKIKYLMLFPLMERLSRVTGSLFLIVIFTVLRWVFMATSTPVMVPCTWVPFFNSMVTVSCDSFIKNLTNFILQTYI